MAIYDDMLAVALERRAAKSFNEKDVPEETLKKIFEFTNTAPTSMGLEEWKVINIRRNSPHKAAIAEYFDNFNKVRAEECSDICIFTSKKQKHYTKDNPDLRYSVERVVEFMTVAKGNEFTPDKADGYHKAVLNQPFSQVENGLQWWSSRQPYMAASFLMLGAQSLGVWNITIEGFQASMDDYLIEHGLIKDDETVTLIVVLGYIEGVQYPYVGAKQDRKPVEEKFFIV